MKGPLELDGPGDVLVDFLTLLHREDADVIIRSPGDYEEELCGVYWQVC